MASILLGEKGAADRNADHELLVAYLCEEPRISSINVIFVEHAAEERGRQKRPPGLTEEPFQAHRLCASLHRYIHTAK